MERQINRRAWKTYLKGKDEGKKPNCVLQHLLFCSHQCFVLFFFKSAGWDSASSCSWSSTFSSRNGFTALLSLWKNNCGWSLRRNNLQYRAQNAGPSPEMKDIPCKTIQIHAHQCTETLLLSNVLQSGSLWKAEQTNHTEFCFHVGQRFNFATKSLLPSRCCF